MAQCGQNKPTQIGWHSPTWEGLPRLIIFVMRKEVVKGVIPRVAQNECASQSPAALKTVDYSAGIQGHLLGCLREWF